MRPNTAFKLGLGTLSLLGLWRAWQLRFLQDDAYISFRYAWNLAHHGELAWNLGERVEGFSNLLWVLLLAAGLRVGVAPEHSSQALGIAAYLAALVLAGLIAKGVLERVRPLELRDLWPLAALALLPMNHSSAAYATGGLSTSLFAAGILLCVWCALLRPLHWTGSLALGGLLWVRPEAMLITPFLAAVVCIQHRAQGPRRLLVWSLPLLGLAAAFISFKLLYFGVILPNTAHAKSVFVPYPSRGWVYLRSFWRNYPSTALLLLPIGLGAFHALRGSHPTLRRVLLPAGSLLSVLVAYVVWVGGDFMEYKPLMHLLPLGAALGAGSLAVCLRGHASAVGALCLLLLAPNLTHRKLNLPRGVHSTPVLSKQLHPESGRWVELGHRLRETLPPDTRIAVTAAGAIPYHSRLPAVDMLGLTNPQVAHMTLQGRGTVGHEKRADREMLWQAGVDLCIGHPTVHGENIYLRPKRDKVYLRLKDGDWLEMTWVHQRPELMRWIDEHPDWFKASAKPDYAGVTRK